METQGTIPESGDHCDETQLENYSMGRLPATDTAALEEHLLVCEGCRKRLTETEKFICAMRAAGKRVRAGGGPTRQ